MKNGLSRFDWPKNQTVRANLHKTLYDKVKSASIQPINNVPTTEKIFSAVQKKHASDFRKILREEKLNEIEEERQQDLRKLNTMISGREDNKDGQDDQFVENLISDIGIKSDKAGSRHKEHHYVETGIVYLSILIITRLSIATLWLHELRV